MAPRTRRGPVLTAAVLTAVASLFALASPSATAADVTWFDLPTMDASPMGVAAGPDGATWVANRASAEIVRVIPGGGHTSFSLESGVDPLSIVQGPDGAMWSTLHHGNRIARLTTSGEVSEFFLRERSLPTGITLGADGALWFAQRGISSIGRVTVDGEISEWPTPTDRAAPLGITSGPDGALWFTEPNINAIGRITTDGAITEYPLPGPARDPHWITTGPDGALWFTERAANAIGRLTVDGRLTEYPVPTPTAGVNGIAVGPDGALWFTESVADAIGRITVRGNITEIPLGEGTSPTGIATGPDGEIWFSAPGVNRIGRLVPSVAVDTTPPLVTIVSPVDGSVLLEGEGMIADYVCSDEPGGSGIASCEGPVPDGAIVPNSLGSHTFTVNAADADGNTASATHGYVVFEDIDGPITNRSLFEAGRTIPIILELGSPPRGDQIFASGSPVVRRVDCETGEAIGSDEPADVQATVSENGRLQIRWRTAGGWGGTCRSLVVRLAFDGWSDADAIFTLHFG